MGKKLRFLGFLASLCVFIFSLNAFAGGYACEKIYTNCALNYYLDPTDQVCKLCDSLAGGAYPYSAGGDGDATSCYTTVILDKNGYSGTINAGTYSTGATSKSYVPQTVTGTTNGTLYVYYNMDTPLPTINLTKSGYANAVEWSELRDFSTDSTGFEFIGTYLINDSTPPERLYAYASGCKSGYYFDDDDDVCKQCPSSHPNSYDGNTEDIGSCYKIITLNKNGYSGEISKGLKGNGTSTKSYVPETKTGTENAQIYVYYNWAAPLPTIDWPLTGYNNATEWSDDPRVDEGSHWTILPANTNITTLYAFKSGCSANYYNDNGDTCENCPAGYRYSDASNNNGSSSCYRIATLDKNGFTGTLTANTGTGCKVVATKLGTENGQLRLYYDTACTLPEISGFTQTPGYTNADSWSLDNTVGAMENDQFSAGGTSDINTVYVRKKSCAANYYVDNGSSCSSCEPSRTHSGNYADNTLSTCECHTGYTSNGTRTGLINVAGGTACIAIKSTITLDQANGSGGTSTIYGVYEDGVYLDSALTKKMTAPSACANPITVPERDGYTFGGYASSTGTLYITSAGCINNDGINAARSNYGSDLTWYAQWTATSSVVTLYKNTSSTDSTTVTHIEPTYGKDMPSKDVNNVNLSVPTRTGYSFTGYYDARSGTSTKYYDADLTSAKTWDKTGSQSLYAQWNANTYTITLDDATNGGSGGMGTVKEVYDSKWTKADGTQISSVTIPTKNNAVFLGYYDAPDGTTQYVTASGQIPDQVAANTFDSDTTIYARFEDCTCTKGNNVDTCTVTGVTANKCQYSYTCKDGYHISGNYQTGDYTHKTDTFTGTAATSSATTNGCLGNTVSLSWNGGGYGGLVPSTPTACTYGEQFQTASPVSNIPGYTFNKWSVNNKLFDASTYITCNSDNLGASAALTSSPNATLTATVSNATYTITLYDWVSGGTGGDGQIKEVYSERYTDMSGNTIEDVTKPQLPDGYTFLGYFINPSSDNPGDKIIDENGKIIASKTYFTNNSTIYSHRTHAQYNVKYDCGTGSGEPPAADTATYTESYTTKNNTCTKENYEFDRWLVSGTTRKLTAGETITWYYTSDKTLTAQWKQNAFIVSYDLNGGDGDAPSYTTCTKDVSCTLAGGDTHDFYRAGYVFSGWNTSASAIIGNSTITVTSDKTVYAVWTPCAQDSYKRSSANANAACQSCPSGYPHTTGTATTTITECFSNEKTRTSQAAHIEPNPNDYGCDSMSYEDCQSYTCSYYAFSNVSGDDDGELKNGCSQEEADTHTCTKTVVAPVVALADYYAPEGASTCTKCSASNSLFPHSDSGTTDSGYCYRDCSPSDVTSAAEVSGRYYRNGSNACVATLCEHDYILTNAGGCDECPTHGVCDGTSTLNCEDGYEKNGDHCDPLLYTVTLDNTEPDATCNGSCLGVVIVTYGEAMPPLTGQLPERTGWSFAGYFDDDNKQYYTANGASFNVWDKTSDATLYAHWSQATTECQSGKYYDGTDHVDCQRGWYCPGTGTAIQGSAGCYVECTTLGAEYTDSDSGSSTPEKCFKTCDTAACVNPCTEYATNSSVVNLCKNPIPENATGCVYDVNSLVAGISYYGSNTCENINNTSCAIKETLCASTYFENPGTHQCELCETYSYGTNSPKSNSGGACGVCRKQCYEECDQQDCPEHNSTCSQEIIYTSGNDYYCSSGCTKISTNRYDCNQVSNPLCGNKEDILCYCQAGKASCPMQYECQGNYDKNASTVTCDPKEYTITLDANGGTGGTVTIKELYGEQWTDASGGTISKITPPSWDEDHQFEGYYTTVTGGTKVIDSDGILPVTTTIGLADAAEGGTESTIGVYTTLYARWSTVQFTCTPGQKANGYTCPEGYYCPGGTVSQADKDTVNIGCHVECPPDARGGTISSPEGSSLITQCNTTRTSVPLNDLDNGQSSGGGDQFCKYIDDNDHQYKDCQDITIKYCNGGYYRVKNDATVCSPVGTGNWSPDATNTIEDKVSMERYPCSVLPGYINATTEGENSKLPTACYNTCPTVNVTDGNTIIGTRAPVNTTESFNGTISAYNYTERTVTTNGSYASCTYQAPVCNAGYHVNGDGCEPNIYTFTLNKNGGTGGDDGPIYMKYSKGWFMDADATVAFTQIALPNKGDQNCSGYEATIDGSLVSVIDGNGLMVASNIIVNYSDTSVATELTASWAAKQTTVCTSGQYFSNADDECKACPDGFWCPGGTAFSGPDRIGQDVYINACPPATAGTTYTPAQAWNGETLNDVAPNVRSDKGRNEQSDCYATVQYTPESNKGQGSQKCYYGGGTYSSDCEEKQILTCNSGWWLDPDETTPDCSKAGDQYYSAQYTTSRERCPEAIYDVGDSRNKISTDGDESSSKASCVKTGIWFQTTHGGGTKRCHWNSETNSYSINCGSSFRMLKCASGYWDELEGETTADENLDCVEVGPGNWSPGPDDWNATTTLDTASTTKNPCPDGTGAQDVISTTPTTATSKSGDITECYLTCNPTKNLNGTNVDVVNSLVHYNKTKEAYDTCIYDSSVCPADMWCDDHGFHDCPPDKDGIAGHADLEADKKYRDISTCYILYNPWPTTFSANYQSSRSPWGHGTGWVKAYYSGTKDNGDYTNYYNLGALTCDAGYYYKASMTCSDVDICHYSRAQTDFSGETPTIENPGSSTEEVECPVGCTGSATNASNYDKCYKACQENLGDFPHSKTVASIDTDKRVFADSDTTYPACKYHITCDTGYDVQNDNTATPSCEAHTYTITLNKNGGTGSTAASVQCTFNSGACALPLIVDTRDGYSTANKWCTSADGSGTCYNADTTVTTNISSNATDTVLYAQWTPNVYTITLDHNGATTNGAPETVYLKYATGWYSNATATTAINQMTTKPVKGVMAFIGYKNGDVTVIGSDGKFITTLAALTFTTSNATVTADWANAPITCPERTYYAGTGEVVEKSCKECTENHYCPGITVNTNSGQAGLESCPDSGMSPANSKDSSECYKESLSTYVATHGTGTQTCYYDETTMAYSDNCKDFAITTCDEGYWFDETKTTTDCSEVGPGYYSADLVMTRDECPNGGTTDGNTKTSIQDCFKTGLDYTAEDTTGTGTQSCWYTSGTGTSAVYNRECFDKAITACRGGYHRANDTDIVCSEVDYNYYSNEGDIDRHPCEGQGKTRDKTTVDIDLCYEDGLDYVAEHGGGSQTCYWNTNDSAYNIGCGDKTITYCNGGYWLANQINIECTAVDYAHYSPDRDLLRYACDPGQTTETTTSVSENDCFVCPAGSVCEEGQPAKTCSEITNGQYTKSDQGITDSAYCYKECALATNASAMSGRDYYTADDTCAIATCQAGYALQNGACVPCPEGSFCDGTGGGGGNDDNDGAKSCADLGDGSWLYSEIGATSANDCYKTCEGYVEGTCTLTPVDNKVYWPTDCQYTGTSASGNPAEVVNGVCVETDCISTYEMVNGSCRLCNRENALSYKPDGNCIVESCVIGYHPNGSACAEDVVECTNSAPNAVYAEQKWDATRGAFGICTIKSCEDGYHLSSNTCVPNEQVCNIENGVGTKTWNTTTNSWNACIATSCVPGYTNDPAEKNNASEQCSECRNKFSVLGEVAVSSYASGCEIASCMYQGDKYNLEDNICVPICDRPYSDETGSLRWNENTKKCERTCNPGYMSW